MNVLIALAYIAGLGGVYALLHFLNAKTPIPAGCEELLEACGTCSTGSCTLHPTNRLKETSHA